MRIALDYDGTYNRDPQMWDNFIRMAQKEGHEVVVVTFRDRILDWCPDLAHLESGMNVRLYCTGGVAKLWWMSHFGDSIPDIWIDDNPKGIYENSTFSPAQLTEWRAQDG